MVEVWFGLLSVTVVLFAVLDGWNIGAGAVHWLAGRTESDRREIIAALGPLWSWHEVWLLAFGGTFLLAFPKVMATSFSGFYLALWFALWSFILRGISIEVGGHLHDHLWQSWWDFVFGMSSVILAVLLGTALGNVLRGVPLDGSGAFSIPLFTDFGVRGQVGILDWYTISVAVFTTVLLSAHGATYLRLKTEGQLNERSTRLARWLWIAVVVLLPVVSLETWVVRPALYVAMMERPAGWLAGAALLAGAWALFKGLRGTEEWHALVGSCLVIASLLAGAAVGVFPVMLQSTIAPEHSLTAYRGAASGNGLVLALVWWPVALVLALTYFAVVMRHYLGKVTATASLWDRPDG